ncbi:MAG: 16S rRNA (cytosine(1402)-N(4))-methyltransferase RsmH [Candidatus Omnitrophica bacterium]|nr:16S rRNA (cytosine(1402)-N(4))-methyltransferase RsmH [Candidatus Omnitrophota bacterium]
MINLHIPVLEKETIAYLRPKEGMVILDCTVGAGGHAAEILGKLGGTGLLIGIDLDKDILKLAEEKLRSVSRNYSLIQGNFRDLETILSERNIEGVDGALFDLGISSFQIDSQERGFSIKLNGPLDMRMDRSSGREASKIVNSYSKEDLAELFKKYGDERFSARIAERITKERRRQRIVSTHELARIVTEAIPRRFRNTKIHPATRVFMALRIEVNNEIDNLKSALNMIVRILKTGARLCIISFHSIEDRIVKHTFRNLEKAGKIKVLTKKPIRPSLVEADMNPRSRSAKLRVCERL